VLGIAMKTENTAQSVPAEQKSLLRLMACVLFCFVALVSCSDSSPSQPEKIRVAVLPDQSSSILLSRYGPFLEYLEQETGVDFELYVPTSYEEAIRVFVEGQAELAFFGGLSFLRVQALSGAVPLAMRDIDARFTSVFLADADSPFSGIEDYRDKSFSFGSRTSTSGHLMPRFFLSGLNIEPETFFGAVDYSGAHDKTIYAVRDNNAALGAANARTYVNMIADGRIEAGSMKVIWETPPYSDYVWVVQPTISKPFRKILLEAFIKLDQADPTQKKILNLLDAGSFLPASMADFAELKKIAQSLQLLE